MRAFDPDQFTVDAWEHLATLVPSDRAHEIAEAIRFRWGVSVTQDQTGVYYYSGPANHPEIHVHIDMSTGVVEDYDTGEVYQP